jgi:hypothetical protein
MQMLVREKQPSNWSHGGIKARENQALAVLMFFWAFALVKKKSNRMFGHKNSGGNHD